MSIYTILTVQHRFNLIYYKMKTLSIQSIEDSTEMQVIKTIEAFGNCYLGDVVKELRLSYSKGLKVIRNMMNKGWIAQVPGAYLNLNVNLEK